MLRVWFFLLTPTIYFVVVATYARSTIMTDRFGRWSLLERSTEMPVRNGCFIVGQTNLKDQLGVRASWLARSRSGRLGGLLAIVHYAPKSSKNSEFWRGLDCRGHNDNPVKDGSWHTSLMLLIRRRLSKVHAWCILEGNLNKKLPRLLCWCESWSNLSYCWDLNQTVGVDCCTVDVSLYIPWLRLLGFHCCNFLKHSLCLPLVSRCSFPR